MSRPLWTGSVAFGIVTIPVQLHAAVRDHDVHFHQISRTDRRRIRYKKVAEGSDEEVPAEDIVKGLEVEPGRYVVFDEEELRKLASRKSRVIEISAFVKLDEIDPRLFDRPYYLLPGEGAGKPYRLLADALERSGRVGIAQMVMHAHEYLVAVRSLDGLLCLETMRFGDELVGPDDLGGAKPPAAKLSERELDMAERLIDSMTTSFDPTQYRDEYRDRVEAAIARKAKGKTLEVESDEDREPVRGKTIDLMEALQRSLERTKRPAPSATRAGPRPRKRQRVG